MSGDRKEYHAWYWRENKERLTQKQKERRERNKDIIKYRRHLAYEANKEKRLRDQRKYLDRKSKYMDFDYPFIEEWRKNIKTNRWRFEYDRTWKRWKDSMDQHHLERRQKHLQKNKNRKEHEKIKKIEKRKEDHFNP